MSEATLFNGGLPYGPDVNRLKETFPVSALLEGTIISHDQIEKVVRQKRGTQRYYGVTNSWMKQQLNDNGIFMVWEPATGIKVLDPAGILECAETRTRQKIRQTGKAVRTFGWVDRTRLDDTGQKRLDHQLRIAGAMKQSLESAKKELAVELAPVKSLPKPALVQRSA